MPSVLVQDWSLWGCRNFFYLTALATILVITFDSQRGRRCFGQCLCWVLRRVVCGVRWMVAAMESGLAVVEKETDVALDAVRVESDDGTSGLIGSALEYDMASDATMVASIAKRTPLDEAPKVRRNDSGVNLAAMRDSPPSQAPQIRHTLFVCVKCDRKRDPTKEALCMSGMAPVPAGMVLDMEDMVTALPPPSPTPSVSFPITTATSARFHGKKYRVKSGQRLYKQIVDRQTEVASPAASVRACLDIKPVECLSHCATPNAIAYAAPGKYTYQFGGIKDGDKAAINDVLGFARDWVKDVGGTAGFSKVKDRPTALKSTILARIPPVMKAPVTNAILAKVEPEPASDVNELDVDVSIIDLETPVYPGSPLRIDSRYQAQTSDSSHTRDWL